MCTGKLPLLINKALREASRPTIRGVRGAEPPNRDETLVFELPI